MTSLFRTFRPDSMHVPLAEKVRNGIAGGAAILLLGLVLQHVPQINYPLLMLGPMAASAVLLYALPHSPLAQPWNLVCGHFVAVVVGWLCITLIHDPLLAASIGVGTTILVMHLLNSLHPPGAATVLTIILGSSQFSRMGWDGAMLIVMINTGIALALAYTINTLLLGKRYPVRGTALPVPEAEIDLPLERQDIKSAIARTKGAIHISEDDLTAIYAWALRSAQERRSAAMNCRKVSCRDTCDEPE
jgi:CBS domain-containing membrane protein